MIYTSFEFKQNKKTDLLPSQQGALENRLEIIKGRVVFFEKTTQKISTQGTHKISANIPKE